LRHPAAGDGCEPSREKVDASCVQPRQPARRYLAESDPSVTKPDAETNLLFGRALFQLVPFQGPGALLLGGLPAATAPGDERPNLSDLLEKTIGCEPCQVSAQPSLKGLATLAKRRW